MLQLSEWFTSARSVRGAGVAHSSTLPPPSPSFLRPDEGGADIRRKGGVEAGRETFPQSSRVSVSLRRRVVVHRVCLCVCVTAAAGDSKVGFTGRRDGKSTKRAPQNARVCVDTSEPPAAYTSDMKAGGAVLVIRQVPGFTPTPPPSRSNSLTTRADNYAQTRTCFPHKHVRIYQCAGVGPRGMNWEVWSCVANRPQ